MHVNKYYLDIESYQGGYLKEVSRECGAKHDIAAVLLYDYKKDLFVLIEQFRIGLMVREVLPWTTEIVAGFVDSNETIEQTAIRESFEETGCKIKKLKHLLSYYPGPGGSAAKVHLFIGSVDSTKYKPFTGIASEGEDIKVITATSNEVKSMIKKGIINTAISIIAFQYFFMNLS